MRSLVRSVRQLQRLAVFEAVGRLGSFSSAAAEFGMSQPAVSKQMRALEGTLGVALFDRGHNRARLTPDGLLLHQAVSDSFEVLERRLADLRRGGERLRVAVQPSVAESWFVPHLGALREAVAPTEVELVVFDHDRELAGIEHDVSVRFAARPAPGGRTERLVPEEVVPLASPELAEALGLSERSAAADLVEAPLLHVDHTDRGWLDWPAWFAGHGLELEVARDAMRYPTYGSAFPLAISGAGVMLGWRTLTGEHLRRGLLRPVGPPLLRPDHGYDLHWPAALTRDAGLQRLRAWLREVVRSQA
ncbi:LysR family transcriptional regulator [Nocardioides sp.]|uniref:LysR family transcriptional regulator n=1 Tax=Nocardioides sp. TaxID=35761 RepID=UPI003528778D